MQPTEINSKATSYTAWQIHSGLNNKYKERPDTLCRIADQKAICFITRLTGKFTEHVRVTLYLLLEPPRYVCYAVIDFL